MRNDRRINFVIPSEVETLLQSLAEKNFATFTDVLCSLIVSADESLMKKQLRTYADFKRECKYNAETKTMNAEQLNAVIKSL
ncbi:hypothetical protein [Methyloversatilis sp.]|uniref:hypothetical protein n=1 Tax=Methyloversatilis sp. TaxID=2569862 RepID=UPI0035B2CC82